jgi:hypothetical protein
MKDFKMILIHCYVILPEIKRATSNIGKPVFGVDPVCNAAPIVKINEKIEIEYFRENRSLV